MKFDCLCKDFKYFF